MKFGRFSFARSGGVLTFSLVLLCGMNFTGWAQEAPASSPVGNAVPALPPAQPIAQAAVGSANKSESAKTAPDSAPSSPVAVSNEDLSLLRLGAGDLIEVSVYNVPELTTKARVGTSGEVYLPLIDYVHVADLTVEEAQRMIQKRLEDGGFVRNAHVTIFLDEAPSQGVTILGDVMRPGIYPALGNRKLYDLISAAGGFAATAGRKVSIVRAHSQAPAITVSLPRNLADDLQDNIEIMPGDTITVPRAPIVYVVGDVGHPAGFLVDNGSLTVLQALALAGFGAPCGSVDRSPARLPGRQRLPMALAAADAAVLERRRGRADRPLPLYLVAELDALCDLARAQPVRELLSARAEGRECDAEHLRDHPRPAAGARHRDLRGRHVVQHRMHPRTCTERLDGKPVAAPALRAAAGLPRRTSVRVLPVRDRPPAGRPYQSDRAIPRAADRDARRGSALALRATVVAAGAAARPAHRRPAAPQH